MTKLLIIVYTYRIKCLSYSKINAILCVLYFLCLNLGKHVSWCQKISFSLFYLTLVTSCIIGPLLCCHLLYLIIYLGLSNIKKTIFQINFFIQRKQWTGWIIVRGNHQTRGMRRKLTRIHYLTIGTHQPAQIYLNGPFEENLFYKEGDDTFFLNKHSLFRTQWRNK